ncbi:NusG domain II-containing protein [Alloiococcus sp. CFN-8]|uniref:NusG domain II-containing protein n=1 Tax=Alloiococcus sp. CFN-8 TaxID=3416081 RepID=UPI003CECF418
MKKLDIIIIAVLLIISFIPEVLFGIKYSVEASETYAEITIGGKLYKTVSLSENGGEDSFIVHTDQGFNEIEIKDNSIAIIDANCNDKLCLEIGHITDPGESIICLPHKLMIEVKGTTDDSSPLDSVAY